MSNQSQYRQKSPLDELVEESKFGKIRFNMWLIALLVLGLLTLSFFAKLDEVAIATGEVVPQEQLKVVQHLEGGVVENILVREGDEVKTGDIVMQLNLGAGAVNRDEILAALDALKLREQRLQAEIDDTDLSFDRGLQNRRPNIAQSQMAVFESRKQELRSSIAVANEKILQKELEVEELRSHQKALERDITLARQRLTMSGELLEQGLTPRMQHVSLEAEVAKMEGELAVMRSSVPRARAAFEQAKAEKSEQREAFRRRAIEEMSDVRDRQSRLNESLATASEQARRADIRAPIDGVVKTLRFNTVGGVVRPGEAIMDIVPETEQLIIQAKLDPKDRGYVIEGLPARVKISTFDYARYGDLEGVVERISASTDTTQEGQAYYRVVVRTEKSYLGEEAGQFEIQPGMQAVVDIHTGSRTVIDFIIRPVLKLRHEAFRER